MENETQIESRPKKEERFRRLWHVIIGAVGAQPAWVGKAFSDNNKTTQISSVSIIVIIGFISVK